MKNRIVLAALLVVVSTNACTLLANSDQGPMGPAQAPPPPHPPHRSCEFPDSEEITALGSGSSFVMRGSVGSAESVSGDSVSAASLRYRVDAVDVLWSEATSTPPTSIWIVQIGSIPAFTPGPNFLFLEAVHGLDDTYIVTDGMYGAFPVSEGRVQRLCPNYESPGVGVMAEGSTPTVEEFTRMLESALNR